MAAFLLLLIYGSALQSLKSHHHVRGRCRAEDPHSPVAVCNPALRSTALATLGMSIRKEAGMQIQLPWTLDSVPVSWKRCRHLLWHKLSPVGPSKLSPTPFVDIGLVTQSVHTAGGCVAFRGTSADQTVVQTETSSIQVREMPHVEAERDGII